MQMLFRLLAYGASVWASGKYADNYWVVGPVFGLAVIVCDIKSLDDLKPVKHAVFLVFSTLIYALVYRISKLSWGDNSDLYQYFIGSFPAAIATGSALMAVTHTVLFNKSKELMVRALVWLIGTFYLVTFVMYFNDKSNLGLHLQWITVMIGVWQGTYLLTFFSKSKG